MSVRTAVFLAQLHGATVHTLSHLNLVTLLRVSLQIQAELSSCLVYLVDIDASNCKVDTYR